MKSSFPWLAALALVTFACFAPTLGFGFLDWDDGLHVTDNVAVVAPGRATIRDVLLTPSLGYPIPVTVASYRLERAILGDAPWVPHLGNALFATTAIGLAFVAGLRLGLSRVGACVAAVLFALHPVAAEPVSWVSGRKDVLATVFVLLALLAASTPGWRNRAASVACFALGLLAKPSIGPLFLLLAVMPGFVAVEGATVFPATSQAARAAAWRLARGAAPYLIVLVPIAVLGVLGQAKVGALLQDTGLSRVRAVWYALGHHASLLLFLEEPTVKYMPAPWPPPFSLRVDLSFGVLVALLAGAVAFTRGSTRRVAVFGAAWAALAYFPVSGVLVPLTRFLSDSYVYLPLLGVGWVFGAVVDAASSRRSASRPFALALAAFPWALAVALAPLFLSSSTRFANDERLWAHARLRFPHQARICRMWANGVAVQRGAGPGLEATDECIEQFGPALFSRNRAVLLERLGRTEEARRWRDGVMR